MADFVSGRDLARAFYEEVVAALVGVPHSAGLLGSGSDVLGYDTERSTDHDWGPRCTVLLEGGPVADVRRRVVAGLPETFHGWPVRIGRAGRPLEPHVVVEAARPWLRGEIGCDLDVGRLSTADWLSVPQQRLLALTTAAVFADDLDLLARWQAGLAWYPDDVWWWLLACQWRRLAQEEAFVQRAAEVGDDLGSRVVAARQVRECMRMALLVARRYAPYGKWLGTAFAGVPDPDRLGFHLAGALRAADLVTRETHLGAAYSVLGRRFNALAPGLAVDPAVRPFHDRPAVVLGADRFAEAALARVRDPALRTATLVGSIDQLVDSTDALASPEVAIRMRRFYADLLRRSTPAG